MADPVTGSCRCGKVKFAVHKPIEFAANCHCSICKKISGGAFSSIAIVDEADLEFTAGRNELTAYRITENASKHFCGKCGTPVYNLHKGFPGKYMIPLGTLDNPRCVTPSVNIHCENMLPWVSSIMDRNNFDQSPES